MSHAGFSKDLLLPFADFRWSGHTGVNAV